MNPLLFVLALLFASPQANAAQAAARAYRISGVVIDANTGAPVPHAHVSVSAPQSDADTTTNSEGRFLFEGLPPGKYSLSAGAEGYVTARYDQHGPFSTGIVVGRGLESGNIVFRLPPEGVIYGTVTDEHGDPLRNAQAILFKVGTTDESQRTFRCGQTQTNDLGQYRFAHLGEGNYYVAVQARPWYAEPGFTHVPEQQPGQGFLGSLSKSDPLLDVVYPVTFSPGVTDPAAANELHITPGDQEEADVQLAPVPSAHVIVTGLPPDPPNGPVRYPGITADEQVFGVPMGVMAPTQEREIAPGEWEIDGIPPGQVTLTIHNNGTPGPSERTIATSVSEGSTIDAASAPAPAAVSGRAIFAPVPSAPGEARVLLVDEQLGRTSSALVHKDGAFIFSPLQPGTYQVRVWLSGARRGQYLRSLSARGAQVSGRAITIPASGNVRLTVAVGLGAGVVNGVAKLAGKPAPGVMVLLVPASGQNIADDSRRDQSDSDGTFTLPNVIPGKYILMAVSNAWNLDSTDAATLKPYRGKGQEIEVMPGETQSVTVNVQPLLKQ